MKKIGICWVFLFFNVYIIQAQILAFKDDFKLEENDMDALIHHYKIDQNGNKMAIIKMVNPNKGFAFDIGSIGDALVEEKKGETWVFVPQNTKRITVNHESLGVLRNYEIPLEIEAGRVYSVTLISGTVKKEVVEAPPDFIKINSIPEGADIFINDIPLNKKTPLTNHSIAIGEYTITLSKPLYYNYKRSVTIKPNEDNKFTFTLRPNFGSLQCIADKDLQDAVIFIDEEEKGSLNKLITPIKTGTHTLLIKKELYADYTTKFTIADGEAKQLNIALTPTFGTILINTNPANSSLFINKEKQPINTVIKKPAGNYFIEITNEKYYTIAKNIELTQQQQYTETITLTPKTGNIEIITTPDEAEVWLNNIKQTRTTPMVIRDVMVGDYAVEIKKNGYTSIKKQFSIVEKQILKIKEILQKTKDIEINTNPSGAIVFIDGKEKGITPYTTSLIYNMNYQIDIFLENYKKFSTTLNQVNNSTSNIYVDLQNITQTIRITSDPKFAKIYIDGVEKGTTPYNAILNINTNYKIDFALKDYRTDSREITVNTTTSNIHSNLQIAKSSINKIERRKRSRRDIEEAGYFMYTYHKDLPLQISIGTLDPYKIKPYLSINTNLNEKSSKGILLINGFSSKNGRNATFVKTSDQVEYNYSSISLGFNFPIRNPLWGYFGLGISSVHLYEFGTIKYDNMDSEYNQVVEYYDNPRNYFYIETGFKLNVYKALILKYGISYSFDKIYSGLMVNHIGLGIKLWKHLNN